MLSKMWENLELMVPLLQVEGIFFKKELLIFRLPSEAFTLPCRRNCNRCKRRFRTLTNICDDFF